MILALGNPSYFNWKNIYTNTWKLFPAVCVFIYYRQPHHILMRKISILNAWKLFLPACVFIYYSQPCICIIYYAWHNTVRIMFRAPDTGPRCSYMYGYMCIHIYEHRDGVFLNILHHHGYLLVLEGSVEIIYLLLRLLFIIIWDFFKEKVLEYDLHNVQIETFVI